MKRLFDIAVSLAALALLAPVLCVVAILVRMRLGSPILFVQERAGLHGQPFRLMKFRTMRDAFDAQGHPLPDDQRLTTLGQFLRKSSLDELPELWNILRGDMSLVGPRPLLMRYLERYSAEQARRHEVRPGLTGWAQINGRNTSSWNERFAHDVWYIDNRSFLLDLKICFTTAWKVIACRDTSAADHATMPEFFPEGKSVPQSAAHNARVGVGA